MRVTLYDYGVGNIHSIAKALRLAGADVTVTTDARDLLFAPALVLPGVGAFEPCVKGLLAVRRELVARLDAGVPCLAVCIGMQILHESSEEAPGVPGLGFVKGSVKRLPPSAGKVPQMGWNRVEPAGAESPVARPTDLYFVHSYYCVPQDEGLVTARCTYGVPFAAALAKANVRAVQFHPEKSSREGLAIVDRFVRFAERVAGEVAAT